MFASLKKFSKPLYQPSMENLKGQRKFIFLILLIFVWIIIIFCAIIFDTFSIRDNRNGIDNPDLAVKDSKYLIIALNVDNPYNNGSIIAMNNQKQYALFHNYAYKVFTRYDIEDLNFNIYNCSNHFYQVLC